MYLDNYYYQSSEQINCVYERDKYCVTDTYIFRIMRKELCRSVRPPYVDIDNVHYIGTIMISVITEKEEMLHNLLFSQKNSIEKLN
jgi:hypothetical protein